MALEKHILEKQPDGTHRVKTMWPEGSPFPPAFEREETNEHLRLQQACDAYVLKCASLQAENNALRQQIASLLATVESLS